MWDHRMGPQVGYPKNKWDDPPSIQHSTIPPLCPQKQPLSHGEWIIEKKNKYKSPKKNIET